MRFFLAAALLLSASSAKGLDSLSFVYGQGNNVSIFAGEARTGEWGRWPLGNWQFSAHGMGAVAYWRAREETEHKDLWDFSVAPVLRLDKPGSRLYFEASLGAHWLSARQINGHRAFSTSFQFGEYVAAGFTLGPRGRYGVDLRLHHVSNGGIENPNPGLTYTALSLRYSF